MKKQKIVITGGCGYLGSVITEYLLSLNKYEIVVIDNLIHRQLPLINLLYQKDIKLINENVLNYRNILPYIQEADIIIPLAAYVGFPACDKYPTLATAVNQHAIEWLALNTRDDQKIIYPTTNSGYGIGSDGIYCNEESPLNPISLYGETKVNAEKALLKKGNAVTLRLATVFGLSPRMRLDLLVNDFTYKALKDGYIVLFESHFKRNYIHIRDVAQTFQFAIDNFDKMKGQPYNVGLSSANISKLELCEKIKEYISDFHISQAEIGKDPDQRNYIVSNDKLESLGWKPQFSLDDGIKEIIKAYPLLNSANNLFTNL
jgi:nucleoside-diphosphate-sugar epimerase